MRDRLIQHRDRLKEEYETGRKRVAQMGAELDQLRQALMRIGGAIEALDEEIARMAAEEKQDV